MKIPSRNLPLSTIAAAAALYQRASPDPTVRSVPLVANNPEAGFFEGLKKFRFADGGAFDFRGARGCSAEGNAGALSNSNQHGGEGFITTYEVERAVAFVGKFKLDWVFVKPPGLTDPYAEGQPHRFAPHFGRTPKLLNDSVEGRISDHDPIAVDLPLDEPGDHRRAALVRRSDSRPAFIRRSL